MNNIFETPFGRLLYLAAVGGGSPPVERTATGNPLTFQTDLAKPLESLLIPFTPRQSGTGDPSPQNIRSILPWNGLTVFGGGKNLFNGTNVINGYFSTRGNNTIIYGASEGRTVWCPCKPDTVYAISKMTGGKRLFVYVSEEEPKVNTVVYSVQRVSGSVNDVFVFRTTSNARYICAFVWLSTADTEITAEEMIASVQIEVGDTATAYEPYHPINETDIVFTSPVYGGSAEIVSGAMMQTIFFVSAKWKDFEGNTAYTDTVRRDLVIPYACLYGSAGNGKTLCNVAKYKYNNDDDPHFYLTDAKRIRCFMPKDMDGETEITFACTLAEPIPLESIEPHQLTALVGDNTIWSDADGSMTAVYLVSAAYADSHPVGGLGSGLLGFGSGNPDPDEPGEPDQPDEPAEPDQPGEE